MLTIEGLRNLLAVEARKQRAKNEDIDALLENMSRSMTALSSRKKGVPTEAEKLALIKVYSSARACIHWEDGDYADEQGCSFEDYVDTLGQSLDWAREMFASYDPGGAVKEVGVIASIARGALEKFFTQPAANGTTSGASLVSIIAPVITS
jgi:hypothetical protein